MSNINIDTGKNGLQKITGINLSSVTPSMSISEFVNTVDELAKEVDIRTLPLVQDFFVHYFKESFENPDLLVSSHLNSLYDFCREYGVRKQTDEKLSTTEARVINKKNRNSPYPHLQDDLDRPKNMLINKVYDFVKTGIPLPETYKPGDVMCEIGNLCFVLNAHTVVKEFYRFCKDVRATNFSLGIRAVYIKERMYGKVFYYVPAPKWFAETFALFITREFCEGKQAGRNIYLGKKVDESLRANYSTTFLANLLIGLRHYIRKDKDLYSYLRLNKGYGFLSQLVVINEICLKVAVHSSQIEIERKDYLKKKDSKPIDHPYPISNRLSPGHFLNYDYMKDNINFKYDDLKYLKTNRPWYEYHIEKYLHEAVTRDVEYKRSKNSRSLRLSVPLFTEENINNVPSLIGNLTGIHSSLKETRDISGMYSYLDYFDKGEDYKEINFHSEVISEERYKDKLIEETRTPWLDIFSVYRYLNTKYMYSRQRITKFSEAEQDAYLCVEYLTMCQQVLNNYVRDDRGRLAISGIAGSLNNLCELPVALDTILDRKFDTDISAYEFSLVLSSHFFHIMKKPLEGIWDYLYSVNKTGFVALNTEMSGFYKQSGMIYACVFLDSLNRNFAFADLEEFKNSEPTIQESKASIRSFQLGDTSSLIDSSTKRSIKL